MVPELAFEVRGDGIRVDHLLDAHRADAVGRHHGGDGAAAHLDQEPLVALPLPRRLRLVLVRLEDADPPALRLGVEAGHRAAERQGLVAVEAQSFGDDRCPQGHHRGAIDHHDAGCNSLRHGSPPITPG